MALFFCAYLSFRARIEAAETLKILPNGYNLATTFSAK